MLDTCIVILILNVRYCIAVPSVMRGRCLNQFVFFSPISPTVGTDSEWNVIRRPLPDNGGDKKYGEKWTTLRVFVYRRRLWRSSNHGLLDAGHSMHHRKTLRVAQLAIPMKYFLRMEAYVERVFPRMNKSVCSYLTITGQLVVPEIGATYVSLRKSSKG